MSGLKLKLNTKGSGLRTSSISTPSGIAPFTTSTPIAATPGGTSIKLKFNTKPASARATPVPSTPAAIEEPKKTKAGRQPKATAKKRQIKEEPLSDEEQSKIIPLPAHKKIKLNTGIGKGTLGKELKTPIIKAKYNKTGVGKVPKRVPGEGYDSEASDREEDPVIEEQFIFRMQPGEDCEYLRDAVTNKKIGLPKANGGADVQMKFFEEDGRRAAITVRGRVYAATLVDLPTVTEGMKSWDKRGWWKSADICQMLWVFATVHDEEEAKTIDLPAIIDKQTHQYPHGLTPPMQFARMRRFRKRISRNAIEAVEDQVAALLQADKEAKSSSYVRVNPDDDADFSTDYDGEGYEDGEEDAEGELDDGEGYFTTDHHGNDEIDADLEADLQADLEAELEADSVAATPVSTSNATPMLNAETPAAEATEDSGDSSGEEDNEGDGADEVDEAEKARQNQIQGIREDIAELEKKLSLAQSQLAAQFNKILRARLEDGVRKLKAELQLKKSSLGEDEDEVEEA